MAGQFDAGRRNPRPTDTPQPPSRTKGTEQAKGIHRLASEITNSEQASSLRSDQMSPARQGPESRGALQPVRRRGRLPARMYFPRNAAKRPGTDAESASTCHLRGLQGLLWASRLPCKLTAVGSQVTAHDVPVSQRSDMFLECRPLLRPDSQKTVSSHHRF